MKLIIIAGLPRSGNNLLKNILVQHKNFYFHNVYEEFKFRARNVIVFFHPSEYPNVVDNLKNIYTYRYEIYLIFLKRKSVLNCAISLWLLENIFTDLSFKSDISLISNNYCIQKYKKFIYEYKKEDVIISINKNIEKLRYQEDYYYTMFNDIPQSSKFINLEYYYEDLIDNTRENLKIISDIIGCNFENLKALNTDRDAPLVKEIIEYFSINQEIVVG